ncbi:MAG: ATP-binding protein [Trueperaceae bacterium]|nr:ATP-binding protein [Trueperaceae bacterium]
MKRHRRYIPSAVVAASPEIATGLGFALALDKLFQRFTTSALSEQRGTGLGLAIVRALVVLHGGWVAARNQDGARIDVWLPFGEGSATRPTPPRTLS